MSAIHEEIAELIWQITDDGEENAQTGEVSLTLTKAQSEKLYGLFYRLDGKYARTLRNFGWPHAVAREPHA